MTTGPRVSAYVRIPDDCSMSCRFGGAEDIEVQFGGYRDGFELVIQREGLARLVRLGHEVLGRDHGDDRVVELDTVDGLGS